MEGLVTESVLYFNIALAHKFYANFVPLVIEGTSNSYTILAIRTELLNGQTFSKCDQIICDGNVVQKFELQNYKIT